MKYNWQHLNWPVFNYNIQIIHALSLQFAEEAGEVKGILQGLGKELQRETELDIMLSEAIKSSEIEGEYISRQDVMSTLKKNLGMTKAPSNIKDKRASGFAELILAVKSSYDKNLTIELIREWHKMLMTGNKYIAAGTWRTREEPMQIISGTIGKEEIHYEAPPSSSLPFEMERFVDWYNNFEDIQTGMVQNALLKSSLAHLYFETILPFEEGNGRIGRAIAEHALSSAMKRSLLLSISKSIEKNKKQYYMALKSAQRKLEVNEWIQYFTQIILSAQQDAKNVINLTFKKAKLLNLYKEKLNVRQIKVILKIFEHGHEGFEGGMTAKKYIVITKCSKASATRDLQELYKNGIFYKDGAGRSVRYNLI